MNDVGEKYIYLVTQLADYPHIEEDRQFSVIFYALLETLPVPEKYHQIFGKALEVKF